MAYTKYSSFTNSEFLNLLDGKVGSPIIAELAQRLNNAMSELAHAAAIDNLDGNVRCPVCEAGLELEYDGDNQKFSLTMKETV